MMIVGGRWKMKTKLESKILSYEESRKKYFTQLINLGFNFSVSTEVGDRLTPWIEVRSVDIDEMVTNTGLHREILPNEWVFDIDGENWESVRELARRLEEVLEKWKIPFNRWSSGRWLHYHVFVDMSELYQTELPEWYWKLVKYHFGKMMKMEKITTNDLVMFQREVHKLIPLVLIEEIEKVDGAYFDLNKFVSSRSLIRAEGSINPKTRAYKTFLEKLPQEQELVGISWKVKFPEKIEVWKPEPKVYDNLFLVAYWNYLKPRYELPIESQGRVYKPRNKVKWIEKLLEIPISDGRHRAVNLIFAPYFMNILKVDEATALEKIMEWIGKCNELSLTKVNQNYVLYQLRYSKKRGLKPLGKAKLKEVFSDVVDFPFEVIL